MKVSALLTARGNNTLKNKNIIKICSKPVLYYPALAALGSEFISDFYCSSDDKKILSLAKKIGYKSILRPDEISMPYSLHSEAIFHALKVMEVNHSLPDILLVLMGNSVTIKTKWIDDCIGMIYNDTTVSAVVPVYKDNDHHPARAKKISGDGILMPFLKSNEKTSSNRQDLSACYFLSHNFWVLNVEQLLRSSGGDYPWPFMGKKVLP
jgi:CMP-N,N'-diacetyllegionaminic acid synthase